MSKPEFGTPVLSNTGRDAGRAFPTLTPKQISRIAAHGRRTETARGDVLLRAGERGTYRERHGAVHGIENANVAPGPLLGAVHNRPWCFSMMERLTDSPMPMPSRFVV